MTDALFDRCGSAAAESGKPSAFRYVDDLRQAARLSLAAELT